MDIRRGVRGVGKTLIAAGVLILLFVAYQLWGTGLAEARSQRQLTKQFERTLAAPTTTTAPSRQEEPPPRPPPPPGDAIAILKIPKLGLEKAVVEGVEVADLKKGPGHYPSTPMPGQNGNAAIAGHRTTYGAPFLRLDELAPGDVILVTTREDDFEYKVTESKIVEPGEVSVLDETDDDRLTLTTCHPRYSARERLIVVASLSKGEVSEAPTTAPAQRPRAELEGGQAGLSGEAASNEPAIGWGMLAALVWVATWWAGRRWQRVPAYLVGTPVFL
ncbi:MAG TPA: class E sortase, partial [Acidimicrobiales bacterium]|nr:class E sortase [Acidimicrobiales bacterium]